MGFVVKFLICFGDGFQCVLGVALQEFILC